MNIPFRQSESPLDVYQNLLLNEQPMKKKASASRSTYWGKRSMIMPRSKSLSDILWAKTFKPDWPGRFARKHSRAAERNSMKKKERKVRKLHSKLNACVSGRRGLCN